MTDFRALCAELADELDAWIGYGDEGDTADAQEVVDRARAVLARWGRPAPATAGEVGELADFVRGCADDYESHGRCRLIRAADLLSRLSPPQPIPVSERLPGPGDCDAKGRCWLGGEMFAPGDPTWVLGFPTWAERFPEVHRFWLPAHALPVSREMAE